MMRGERNQDCIFIMINESSRRDECMVRVKLDVIMYDIESSRREECTMRVRQKRGIYNES